MRLSFFVTLLIAWTPTPANAQPRVPWSPVPEYYPLAYPGDSPQESSLRVTPLSWSQKDGLVSPGHARTRDGRAVPESQYLIQVQILERGKVKETWYESEKTLLAGLKAGDLEHQRYAAQVLGHTPLVVSQETNGSLTPLKIDFSGKEMYENPNSIMHSLLQIAKTPGASQSHAIDAIGRLLYNPSLGWHLYPPIPADARELAKPFTPSPFLRDFYKLTEEKSIQGQARETLLRGIANLTPELRNKYDHLSDGAADTKKQVFSAKMTGIQKRSVVFSGDGQPYPWKQSMDTPENLIVSGTQAKNVWSTDTSEIKKLLTGSPEEANAAAALLGQSGIREPYVVEALFIAASKQEIRLSAITALQTLIDPKKDLAFHARLERIRSGAAGTEKKSPLQNFLLRQVKGENKGQNADFLVPTEEGTLVSNHTLLESLKNINAGSGAPGVQAKMNKLVRALKVMGPDITTVAKSEHAPALDRLIEVLLTHASNKESALQAAATDVLGSILTPDSVYTPKFMALADGHPLWQTPDHSDPITRIMDRATWIKAVPKPYTYHRETLHVKVYQIQDPIPKKSFSIAFHDPKDQVLPPEYLISAQGDGVNSRATDADLMRTAHDYTLPKARRAEALRILGESGLFENARIRRSLVAAALRPNDQVQDEAIAALSHFVRLEADMRWKSAIEALQNSRRGQSAVQQLSRAVGLLISLDSGLGRISLGEIGENSRLSDAKQKMMAEEAKKADALKQAQNNLKSTTTLLSAIQKVVADKNAPVADNTRVEELAQTVKTSKDPIQREQAMAKIKTLLPTAEQRGTQNTEEIDTLIDTIGPLAVKVVQDSDATEKLRLTAIETIQRIEMKDDRPAYFLPGLLQLVQAEKAKPELRRASLFALADLDPTQLIPVLTAIINDPNEADPEIREFALKTLIEKSLPPSSPYHSSITQIQKADDVFKVLKAKAEVAPREALVRAAKAASLNLDFDPPGSPIPGRESEIMHGLFAILRVADPSHVPGAIQAIKAIAGNFNLSLDPEGVLLADLKKRTDILTRAAYELGYGKLTPQELDEQAAKITTELWASAKNTQNPMRSRSMMTLAQLLGKGSSNAFKATHVDVNALAQAAKVAGIALPPLKDHIRGYSDVIVENLYLMHQYPSLNNHDEITAALKGLVGELPEVAKPVDPAWEAREADMMKTLKAAAFLVDFNSPPERLKAQANKIITKLFEMAHEPHVVKPKGVRVIPGAPVPLDRPAAAQIMLSQLLDTIHPEFSNHDVRHFHSTHELAAPYFPGRRAEFEREFVHALSGSELAAQEKIMVWKYRKSMESPADAKLGKNAPWVGREDAAANLSVMAEKGHAGDFTYWGVPTVTDKSGNQHLVIDPNHFTWDQNHEIRNPGVLSVEEQRFLREYRMMKPDVHFAPVELEIFNPESHTIRYLLGPSGYVPNNPKANDAAKKALSHPDWAVRADAASFLGEAGRSDAPLITILTDALADPKDKVREKVTLALEQLGLRDQETLRRLTKASEVEADPNIKKKMTQVLEHMVSKPCPTLVDGLKKQLS